MIKAEELATKVTLEAMLIATVSQGIRYAQRELSARQEMAATEGNDHSFLLAQAQRMHEGMRAAAEILYSILPGICSAQIHDAFLSVTEKELDTYCGLDMADVELVLSRIK